MGVSVTLPRRDFSGLRRVCTFLSSNSYSAFHEFTACVAKLLRIDVVAAKAGTTVVLDEMPGGAESNFPGLFGVGSYSTFLVDDNVSISSKSSEDPLQHVWATKSDAMLAEFEDPRGHAFGHGVETSDE